MKFISFLMRYSKRIIALAIFGGIISGASNTALLALTTVALNHRPSGRVIIWCFVALCLIAPLTRMASEILLIRLGQKAIFDIRMQLSRRILAAPLRRLEKFGPHHLLAALTDDIFAITDAIIFIPILCINIAVVIGCLFYLGWLSLIVLLAVLGFIIVGVAGYRIPIGKAAHHLKLARAQRDGLYKHFRGLTDGAKELKLHSQRREKFLNEGIEPVATAYRRQFSKGMSIYTAAAGAGHLMVFILIGLLLFALPAYKDISTQTLTGYTLTILYMMTPLQVIINGLPNLGRAGIAMEKIESLGLSLEVDSNKSCAPARVLSEPILESLELAGVTHAYHHEREESDFRVGPIDLTFYPGELVFLVGGNGSGKTTLAKLIIGLYTPESGEIRFNGQLVNDETREAYRQLFSVVFSDFYLFETFFGLDGPELDAEARDYLARLQLSHKVQVKDGALTTTELSQGQRKRLALLTAYLEDRPIYLFDEWAADQDPLFKDIFYFQILPELKSKGKTVFVISHDDHYYGVADRIIKLDYGKLDYEQQINYAETATAQMVGSIQG